MTTSGVWTAVSSSISRLSKNFSFAFHHFESTNYERSAPFVKHFYLPGQIGEYQEPTGFTWWQRGLVEACQTAQLGESLMIFGSIGPFLDNGPIAQYPKHIHEKMSVVFALSDSVDRPLGRRQRRHRHSKRAATCDRGQHTGVDPRPNRGCGHIEDGCRVRHLHSPVASSHPFGNPDQAPATLLVAFVLREAF